MWYVIDSRWTGIALPASVGLLILATMVWLSGADMLIGWMLIVVLGGWSLVAIHASVSFVRLAPTRPPHWFREWAVVSLGCLAAFTASMGVGFAGVPEDVRIGLSRDALIDAGKKVLAGEHPARAGLYGFRDTRVSSACAMLETGGFAIDSFGFAYCPTRAPAGFEHVGGPLYKYTYD